MTLGGHHNRGLRLPIEVLTPDEFIAINRQTSGGPTGVRNRALLALLYGAGLRLSEALGLYRKDVDLELGLLHVLHGKGNRRRAAAIDPDNLEAVAAWTALREQLVLGGAPVAGPLAPFICTLRGGRLHPSYCRRLLARLGLRAGVAKRVHPHGLRHSLAAQLAREGVPVNVIQQQLGHRSVATTSRYLEHVLPAQLLETMSKRRPLTGGR